MNPLKKYISILLSFTLMSLSYTSTQAAVVSNELIINQAQHSSARTALIQTLNRSDVKQELLNMGVTPADVENRIALMTQEEIAQLSQQIDELPAGGDVLGVLLIIFLVFVITDIIGATNIFPFIKPVN